MMARKKGHWIVNRSTHPTTRNPLQHPSWLAARGSSEAQYRVTYPEPDDIRSMCGGCGDDASDPAHSDSQISPQQTAANTPSPAELGTAAALFTESLPLAENEIQF